MKKLSLKTILVTASGLLAFIAFFLMFAAPLCVSAMGHTANAEFSEVYFGTEVSSGAIGAFIGFLMMLLAGLALLTTGGLAIAKKGNTNKIIVLVSMVLLLVGFILVFCTKELYFAANEIPAEAGEGIKLAAGPIVGGIFGILALLGSGASLLLKK